MNNKQFTPPQSIVTDTQIPDSEFNKDNTVQIEGYLQKSRKYKGFHYSVLTQDMIDYLHSKTLEITKEVLKIFDLYDIRYMICGGTLLGAVTTGKFIPWDDDVDICVLEDDYEKMKQALLKNLPDWIIIQCDETEPSYYHGWIKVRDKKSKVFPNEPNYQYNGVWLDLYKLTLVKNKEVPYLISKEHLNYLNRRYVKGCISKEERDKRVDDNNLLNRIKIEEETMLSSNDESEVYMIWSASKILVEKQWCFPAQKYSFEGLQLKSFSNPEAYLVRHYGMKYQQLPPDELRRVGINKIEY